MEKTVQMRKRDIVKIMVFFTVQSFGRSTTMHDGLRGIPLPRSSLTTEAEALCTYSDSVTGRFVWLWASGAGCAPCLMLNRNSPCHSMAASWLGTLPSHDIVQGPLIVLLDNPGIFCARKESRMYHMRYGPGYRPRAFKASMSRRTEDAIVMARMG